MARNARFTATLDRHRPDLPVYLVVPARAVDAFDRQATFVVEAMINGRPIGRRSIKPWGDGRWFMELTKVQCTQLRVGPGDAVDVELTAAPEVPAELASRIAEAGLSERWAGLSAADRRALAEHIFAAKKAATRAARIDRTLARLRGGDA